MRPFPKEVLATLKKFSFEIYDEMATTDETCARVSTSYREFMESAAAYYKINEQYYYETR